jgi:hypothetical protein
MHKASTALSLFFTYLRRNANPERNLAIRPTKQSVHISSVGHFVAGQGWGTRLWFA